MKKALLLTLVLVCSIAANADSCVTLRSGNPQVLLEKAKVAFTVDWDHAQVTNWNNKLFPQYLQHLGSEAVNKWPANRKKAEEYFVTQFNRKSTNLKIKEGSTDYKMLLRIATFDAGGDTKGRQYFDQKVGGTVINGTIEVRDAADKLLCVMNVNNANGVLHKNDAVRYGLALMKIATDVCDLMKEVKKGKVTATTPVDDSAAAQEAKPATKTKTVKKVVQTVPENMYRVTAQKVNVRSAASTKSTVVGSLLRDEQVEVKGINGSWATVVYKGGTRYVSANYLEKIEPQMVEEEVEEEVEEVAVEEKSVAAESLAASTKAEKTSKASKREKRAQEKAREKDRKTKARADKRADSDSGSRFPSFKADPKYMGEWHFGYNTSGHDGEWKCYTAAFMTGFLQGVTINPYLETGIGVQARMYTHYPKGGDFGDLNWFIDSYAHLRGFLPLSSKVSPFITLDMGPSWMVHPKGGKKPSFYMEFGPGIKYKQFNFFAGLQRYYKGKGANRFVTKVGWYF